MKRRIFLIICAVALVTVSAAAYFRGAAADAAPQFVTAPVTRGDVVAAVEATGTLQAVTTVQVSTQVSGTIKALRADFNSTVKQGQVIAELEPSLFQAQVDQARASLQRFEADLTRARVELEDAQVKLRRARELSEQQLISRADLDAADTTARQAEAAVASAQAQLAQGRASVHQTEVNLANTVIRAPIDGVVISRNVDVGQTVAASTSAPTLFVIARDLSRMQVNASIDESDIGRIATGQAVTFTVDAYPNDLFTGTVSQVRLEPKTESNVVTYVTLIDAPNRDLRLKPGMTATVHVELARANDVQRVPNAALRFRPTASDVTPSAPRSADAASPGGSHVWVMAANGELRSMPVRTGISDGTMTALVDGRLPDRAQVITGQRVDGTTASVTGASPLLPRRPGAQRGAR
jgi:HlyD family secretion protein